MRFYIKGENKEGVVDLIDYEIDDDQKKYQVILQVDGETTKKEIYIRKMAGKYFATFDGKSYQQIILSKNRRQITLGLHQLNISRGFRPSQFEGDDAGILMTKMPGRIIKIFSEEGKHVKAGDTLVTLEAMKMENELKVSCDGKIKKIHVNEGDIVEEGVLLVELEEDQK